MDRREPGSDSNIPNGKSQYQANCAGSVEPRGREESYLFDPIGRRPDWLFGAPRIEDGRVQKPIQEVT